MTALKAEAIRMVEQIPDNQVSALLATIQDFMNTRGISPAAKEELTNRPSAAFENFLSHCKKITIQDDCKDEITEILEADYEDIS